MEISSVASFAASQVPQQAFRARTEPTPSERPRETPASVSRESAPPPPPPEMSSAQARADNAQQAQRTEPPRPVVNDRGQKTGTIIDTTA